MSHKHERRCRSFAAAIVSTGLLLAGAAWIATAQAPPPAVASHPRIVLWPNGAPGALGTGDADIPTLDMYVPTHPNGAAVIVCPGGGYGFLAASYEGQEPAEWMNARSVTAFVLKYRLAPRYHYPAPIQDGQRAIRLVRARAAEWKLDPARIGIWGFSAGGHVASTVATHFDAGAPAAADPIDRASSRPDFAILAYPVITMERPFTHEGSRINLIGKDPSPALVEDLSNEKRVTRETPPTFLFTTSADTVVPTENSIVFYLALHKAGVPAELHVFERGQHGVGLAAKDPVLSQWPVLLEGWLKNRGILRAF